MDLSQVSNSYEQARQQRIARNQRMLADLGLGHSTVVEQPSQIRVRKAHKTSPPKLPVRRSKRQQGLAGGVAGPTDETLHDPASQARTKLLRRSHSHRSPYSDHLMFQTGGRKSSQMFKQRER